MINHSSINFGIAVGGVVTAGLFSYATYAPQHSMAFKGFFVAGVAFSLLAQLCFRDPKVTQKEKQTLKLTVLGLCYVIPVAHAIQLAQRAILLKIFPESWLQQQSAINATFGAAFSLGYTATNVLFESYNFYRSRQSA